MLRKLLGAAIAATAVTAAVVTVLSKKKEKEDKLKETQFDLPYSMKLAKELDKLGVHIKDRMTMEGMVDELCQLHLKK